jgi:hypoxanthine phosphoribosyltransferase
MFGNPIDMRDSKLKSVESYLVPGKYKDDLEGILISGGEIKDRIKRLALDISGYYDKNMTGPEKDRVVYPVVLLGGALSFYGQLSTYNLGDLKLRPVLIRASSYGSGTVSSRKVEIGACKQSELEQLKDKHVLIIDDIIDSGNTLYAIKNKLLEYEPRDIKTCCLLDKPMCRKKDIQPDFLGFQIPEMFVVGYCMDFNEKYRDMPHIAVLKPELYKEIKIS